MKNKLPMTHSLSTMQSLCVNRAAAAKAANKVNEKSKELFSLQVCMINDKLSFRRNWNMSQIVLYQLFFYQSRKDLDDIPSIHVCLVQMIGLDMQICVQSYYCFSPFYSCHTCFKTACSMHTLFYLTLIKQNEHFSTSECFSIGFANGSDSLHSDFSPWRNGIFFFAKLRLITQQTFLRCSNKIADLYCCLVGLVLVLTRVQNPFTPRAAMA